MRKRKREEGTEKGRIKKRMLYKREMLFFAFQEFSNTKETTSKCFKT